MSEWKKVKLRDVCSKIGSGSTPKGGSTVYIDKGTAFIRSQNVYNLAFDYNGLTHITEEAAKKLSSVTIQEEDVLLNITGDSVARTCIVPNNVLPARVNQHVAIVRANREILLPNFLSYYLASPFMQAHMLNLAVGKGASRNAMTKGMIEGFEIPLPPLATQHRIATILSRYDSLIENYQKQIKLLEEAAQRLYKEWFIDLHFPGHENTNIIDGVPEGWEKKKVGELLIKHIGGGWGKDTPTGSYDVGGHVIRGTDITQIENGNMNVPYRYHTESNFKDRRLKEGDIIFEVSGGSTNEPVGRTLFITNELVSYFGNNTICASFCKKMSFKTIQESVIAYFTIRYFRKIGYLHKYEKDSAGKIINYNWNDFLNEFDILFPNQVMLDNISARLQKFITEASKLRSQLRLLTEARDRLLPKLMSGAIEV